MGISELKDRVIILLFFLQGFSLFGQQKFDLSLLANPEKNGLEVAQLLSTQEIYEFKKEQPNCLFLQNGLRASTFINEAEWIKIKDTVEVTKIDIVYSKYPLRNNIYSEIYPLLFDRLTALFQLDSELNDTSIEYNKVLQTHCENDSQVRGLYHGIVIHYQIMGSNQEVALPTKNELIQNSIQKRDLEQNSIQDMEMAVERIIALEGIPDSLKKTLVNQPLDEQINQIKNYLAKKIKHEPDYTLSELSPTQRDSFQTELSYFTSRFKTNDTVVQAVFNRHPEWKNILVVNDWTGSMYNYGSQVLDWHLKNFERSGILSLTLFNDGDMKPQHTKKIGETGGIYMEPADNIPQLVDLFNYVMLQGGGGDTPENDIEAILKSIENYERFSEIVLIADNNACIRDISLADRIKTPVRIIVCGFDKAHTINPHLVYLAKVTNGGIYTIENDIEEIQTEVGEAGELKSFKDKRFKVSKNLCMDIDILSSNQLYTLKNGLRNKKKVTHLNASEEQLKKVPAGVFRMSNLKTINLSKNELTTLSPKIGALSYLKELDLSHNQLTDLPQELLFIRYLENLTLSHNLLDTLPAAIYSMKSLVALDLSHNQLSFFDISALKYLNTLNLSHNQLTTISKSSGKLKELRYLDLSNNAISILPSALAGLRKLRELDLSDNHIEKLPADLKRYQQLKVLRLTGNPIGEDEKNRIRTELKYTQLIF